MNNDEQSMQKTSQENDDAKLFLRKFSFSGRINRLEYIISIAIAIVVILLSGKIEDGLARGVICLVADVFWLSQGVRRLHDFGASGIWVLIPVVSWIFIAFPKGDETENEYGPCPK